MGLPELADGDESDIHRYSQEAVQEAAEALYGEDADIGRPRVYGSCIEPGGMPLARDLEYVKCSCCGKDAIFQYWEEVEGGSLNSYTSTHCEHCGESESTYI